MATSERNRPRMHCKSLSIEYVMYVYGLCLFYLILRLEIATNFYHLVAKWRLNDFVNFEPCTLTDKQTDSLTNFFDS